MDVLVGAGIGYVYYRQRGLNVAALGEILTAACYVVGGALVIPTVHFAWNFGTANWREDRRELAVRNTEVASAENRAVVAEEEVVQIRASLATKKPDLYAEIEYGMWVRRTPTVMMGPYELGLMAGWILVAQDAEIGNRSHLLSARVRFRAIIPLKQVTDGYDSLTLELADLRKLRFPDLPTDQVQEPLLLGMPEVVEHRNLTFWASDVDLLAVGGVRNLELTRNVKVELSDTFSRTSEYATILVVGIATPDPKLIE